MSCCGCECCSDCRERFVNGVRRIFRPQVPVEQAPEEQPQQQPEQQREPEEHTAAAEAPAPQPSVPGTAVQSPSDSETGGLTSSVGDATDTEGRLSAVISPTSSSLTVVSPVTMSSDSREDRAAQDAGSSSGLSSSTLESDAPAAGTAAAGTAKTVSHCSTDGAL
ncbi:hypothetical protein HPB50_007247 [Hyalomma asiaticum]|uniref:Uncharacterized protein n=1 Tax=Hyalomma asiaticum TaxID=266040 RepID=A0ACB7TFK2_HYAAI|nr:hypothetical protein HPB50_007247 [Hyalomma asiaticum]